MVTIHENYTKHMVNIFFKTKRKNPECAWKNHFFSVSKLFFKKLFVLEISRE